MSAVRVFLSYSPEDQAVADAICERIEGRDIGCWIASRDMSETEAQYGKGMIAGEDVVAAIESSEVMVLVFSAASNDSPQVRREIERAVAHNLVIVPFRVEDVPLSKSMEYFISTTHWLNAVTPPLEAHIDYLAKTVEVLVADAAVARHSSLVVQRRAGGPLPGMEHSSESHTSLPSSPSASVVSPLSSPLAQTHWDADEVHRVETALAAYVGPLAKILVKQEQRTASNLGELCQRVVTHIAQPAERAMFLQRCESVLKPAVVPQVAPPAPKKAHGAHGLFARIAGGRKPEVAVPTLVEQVEPEDVPLSAEMLVRVEQQLAESIGPLARVLVKRGAKEARDVSDLYHRLAEHVPAGAERVRFLKHSEKKRA